jgi:hypothetical protein
MIEMSMNNPFVTDNTRNIVICYGHFVFARNDNIVRVTFSVGDTSLRFAIGIQQDNINR